MKKQSSPSLSLPGSALPIKLPQQSYTHMLLDHYECAPNTKSNNISPSATLPSPLPPDRTTQSINPRINFDYNEKDRISNYTNHFPHQSVSTRASCGNPMLPETSTPEFLSSLLELLNNSSTWLVTSMYVNEKSEESYHQEKTGFQCSGCRNLTSGIEILENNTKQVMTTLQ